MWFGWFAFSQGRRYSVMLFLKCVKLAVVMHKSSMFDVLSLQILARLICLSQRSGDIS